MNVIPLSLTDLSIAASLVLMLAGLTFYQGTGQARPLLIAAARTVLQLSLLGLVLDIIFGASRWYWILAVMLMMALVAGHEVNARQNRPFSGWMGYGLGTASMFISTFSVLMLTLKVIVQPQPWFQPQYAIPLFGMLLGNSMTGIALALDRLTDGAYRQRSLIEARLMLGQTAKEAIQGLRIEALRSGLMPITNAMAAAGVVSIPGMMTGQILGGSPPLEAARYQILIMFLIAAASGVGTVIATTLGGRRLFDDRQRLRLERLRPVKT